ncbi:MAG: DUF448 domain-containing protein [Wolinella succinogenes]|nr:DUF448 domain-containing protein [Wolinella succinogenes]
MSYPIRMCVHCKGRFSKHDLLRLQYIQNSLIPYTGNGRSFYLCKGCIEQEKVLDSLCRVGKIDKKEKETIRNSLKEIAHNAKSPCP